MARRDYVYLVTQGHYSNYTILAAFRTFNAAQRYVEQEYRTQHARPDGPVMTWRPKKFMGARSYYYENALFKWRDGANSRVEVYEIEEGPQ